MAISVAERAKELGILALKAWAYQVSRLSRFATTQVTHSCQSPHYYIKIYTVESFARQFNRDLRSFVKAEEGNTIYTHDAAVNSSGVLLHEFGHAFAGLADTYVNNGNYDCQNGHPASLMCSHYRYGSKIMSDDVEGLKQGYAISLGDYLTSKPFFEREFSQYLGEVIANSPVTVKFSDLWPKVTNVTFDNGFPDQILLSMTRLADSQQNVGNSKFHVFWDVETAPQSQAPQFFNELRKQY